MDVIEQDEQEATSQTAVMMEDGAIISMLKKSPKDVPEMHSREAFRTFFTGMRVEKVDFLLRQANAGKEESEVEAKVLKRMNLLAGVLID